MKLFNRAARSPPGRVWNSRELCCRVTKHAGVRRPTHRSLMCCPAGWPGSPSFCRKEKYQDPLVLFLRWLAGPGWLAWLAGLPGCAFAQKKSTTTLWYFFLGGWKVPRPCGTFSWVAGCGWLANLARWAFALLKSTKTLWYFFCGGSLGLATQEKVPQGRGTFF